MKKESFRDIIMSTLKRQGKMSLSKNELMAKSHTKKRYGSSFLRELDKLVHEGLVVEERNRYLLASQAGMVPAEIIRVHSTFGFARLEDGTEIFIPGRHLLGAMPSDRVMLRRRSGEGDLDEGQVFVITEASDALLSGEVSVTEEGAFLLPDGGSRYPILLNGDLKGATKGDKVLARIVHRGQRHADHRLEIIHNFGSADSAENCAAAILAAAGVDRVFTDEVIEEAEHLLGEGITVNDIADRKDLRSWPVFTIDGAATKDIDDAISLTETNTGYQLGVHIADVSHYVEQGDILDREAYERGTSVYYVDKVIPMLPTGLSNGICSLNPNVDRLAFSVLVDIDQDGTMTGYRFFKSVIRSRLKGVYSEINALMADEAGDDIQAKYGELSGQIELMVKLADILHRRQAGRGALELESTECKFLMDTNGEVTAIEPVQRGASEEMIESFMLMANQAAAAFAEDRDLPFIFRVHENPPATKIAGLKELLDLLNIPNQDIEPGVSPAALSRILEQVRGTPYQRIVNNSLLRSMAKAVYSENNIGHYGLVMKQYTHFTSPIRRYPDLYIHRIMSQVLSGEKDADKIRARYANSVKPVAAHCSATEQRAVAAERACVDAYRAEYIRRFIGQTFEGIIVSTTVNGFYVELPNTVEGMVRADRLPGDVYDFDGHMAYLGRNTGKAYRVGDRVSILVASASVSAGRIDFDIA